MESIKLEQNSLNAIPHVSNFYHGSLFSGIGGFDLAAQWNGINNLFQVEIDEFCQKVLTKNFPETAKFKDIKEFNAKEFYGQITILSGGFPCQPFSVAGKRKGTADERYLWQEMLRVISEIKPKWIVAENVYGLVINENGMVLNKVLIDLENTGYEVQPFIIPACGKNAPHRRERIWIVAHNNEIRCDMWRFEREGIQRKNETWNEANTSNPINSNSTSEQSTCFERKIRDQDQMEFRRMDFKKPQFEQFPNQPAICGRNDGIPDRVDRLKSLGNAIVPQIAYEIFRNIIEVELSFQ